MIDLSSLKIDNPINNSYLISSYSNRSFPYVKGKRFESIFGDNKVVQMDSRLNKHYITQMKEQDNIRQEKKILDIIEKIDNKKAFKVLKDDYLKEKLKISKGYYLMQKDNKKDYFTNLFNLENYKDKLFENKSNSSDREFMTSFMNFLGCRPKKIVIKKKNNNIELLSKFKNFAARKKQIEKLLNQKPRKKSSLKLLLQYDNINNLNNIDNKGRNNNYTNYFNTTSDKLYFGLNKKTQSENLKDIDNSKKYNINNNVFNKTTSTNFRQTNYNNFFYDNNNNENNKNYNYFNNLKIEEIKRDNSLQNSLNDSYFMNDNLGVDNIKKYETTKKVKSITDKKKLSKKQKSINSKKINEIINYTERKRINSYKYNNTNSYNNNNKKKIKFLNLSKDEDKEELKMIDLKIINEKLNEKYGKIMKKFLERIRYEEKNINDNSKKLYNSIYLIQKINHKNIFEKKNKKSKKNESNIKKGNLTERNENKKKNYKLKFDEINFGNYYILGKSKYSVPKVNEIIFGSNENTKDDFANLQINLLHEVKKQFQKKGFSKKLRINGKDIIEKLKNKSKPKSTITMNYIKI